ncbi:helix-turn-helix domain-containing protein [Brevibacterium aurantiacum]|uniref:Helix-turn-helix transcriptional regulator n=1 Tax=Brevibacterium aurantiacum TaxID=273384 RepID=A0A556CB63_BREAU|nr:helix-turn-helix transcriptional regulator [Brevibacterium aurantiacum]
MTIGELQLTENERVGREVAAWMTRYNLRQADIAQILGFAQRNVSKRIRGEMPFRIDELLAIARYMGISLSQLLGEGIVNEKNPQSVELTEGSATFVAGGGFEPPTSGL